MENSFYFLFFVLVVKYVNLVGNLIMLISNEILVVSSIMVLNDMMGVNLLNNNVVKLIDVVNVVKKYGVSLVCKIW